jgi:hypothetical protein
MPTPLGGRCTGTHTGQGRCKGQGAHLAIALPDQLGGLSCVSGLQLTGGHDDGANLQLLVGQCALEGLTLSLATPDTCMRSPSFLSFMLAKLHWDQFPGLRMAYLT